MERWFRRLASPKFRRAERVLGKRCLGHLKEGDPLKGTLVLWKGIGHSIEYFDPVVDEKREDGIVVKAGPRSLILTIGKDLSDNPYQRTFPGPVETVKKFFPFWKFASVRRAWDRLMERSRNK